MNPLIAFGPKIFEEENFPDILITGNIESNQYLSEHIEKLKEKYTQIEQYDRFFIYKKIN